MILLDIGLPDMDGYSLASWIRDNENTHIGLFALSAHIDANENHEFDGFYPKPLTQNKLDDILRKIDERSRMGRNTCVN